MTKKLNASGAAHAGSLIREGKIKESENWAPPSAERENSFIQEHGMGEFGKWHLGVDLEADAQSKGRYGFIFTSDFKEVDYAGLRACVARAAQAGYGDIEERARSLYEEAGRKLGKGKGPQDHGTTGPQDRITLCDGRAGLRRGMEVEVSDQSDRSEGSDVLEFVASDETLDRYGEVIAADGWRLENYRRNPVFQNSHQYGDVLFTLGRARQTEVVGGKLVQRIEFATEINPMARIAHGLYKGGFLKAVSVGFVPIKWEDPSDLNPNLSLNLNLPRRRYLEQELLEVSAVSIPANPNALIMGIKSGAVELADVRELAELIRCLGQAKAWTPTQQQTETSALIELSQRHRAATETNSGTLGPPGYETRLLRIARELRNVMRDA